MSPVFKKLLSGVDYKTIADATNYSVDHVRGILHGHQNVTARSMVIIEKAVEMCNDIIDNSKETLNEQPE